MWLVRAPPLAGSLRPSRVTGSPSWPRGRAGNEAVPLLCPVSGVALHSSQGGGTPPTQLRFRYSMRTRGRQTTCLVAVYGCGSSVWWTACWSAWSRNPTAAWWRMCARNAASGSDVGSAVAAVRSTTRARAAVAGAVSMSASPASSWKRRHHGSPAKCTGWWSPRCRGRATAAATCGRSRIRWPGWRRSARRRPAAS